MIKYLTTMDLIRYILQGIEYETNDLVEMNAKRVRNIFSVALLSSFFLFSSVALAGKRFAPSTLILRTPTGFP
ncbi:hypothetical protein P7F88_03570 [Vibrio hannami]|uniref:hypothetical protein n=1 Tax=Vibrio hannami TaxID=2717094 RepID=UPI00240FE516|nr:hypothetical protein [Vibrio hannami]MDG3085228.1 hypothetical protein [Vibrio hannami]